MRQSAALIPNEKGSPVRRRSKATLSDIDCSGTSEMNKDGVWVLWCGLVKTWFVHSLN